MELRDYGTALRRYWTTWVGLALAGVLVALTVVLVSTPTYQATAQVFVASTGGEGTSGAQFVNQRVTTYPDVARSRTVLGSVTEELGIQESFADLRARVAAVNPPDTSQIDISVSDEDPEEAAAIADAVAQEFGLAVELLERTRDGESPVDLTVTNPATVPTSPVFPQPGLLLLLGLVVGLALGAAAAVVRSRTDTRLHTGDDVRAAWGAGAEDLPVHAPPAGRRGRGRPATLLARRLEPLAERQPLRVVAVTAAPGDEAAARSVINEVAAELTAWGVSATSGRPVPGIRAGDTGGTGVRLAVSAPPGPLREWRRLAVEHDGVVLVVRAGRIDGAHLREIRTVLTAADVRLLAVVLVPRRRSARRSRAAVGRPAPSPRPGTETLAVEDDAVLTGR
jgi:capsular polysaccharide biosynthesis protein